MGSRSFYFYRYGAPRDLHSFPTRRSSDLVGGEGTGHALQQRPGQVAGGEVARGQPGPAGPQPRLAARAGEERLAGQARSEEHTSELQSRRDLVCRLLLEKNNVNNRITITW